jgi:hypothetical protein
VASLFVVWFAFGLVGCQWLYDNHPAFAKGDEVRKIDTWGKLCFHLYSIFSVSCIFAQFMRLGGAVLTVR